MEIRRIPTAFAPPDALDNPAQALGRRPATAIPAGSYLVASQLVAARPSGAAVSGNSELAPGVRPVEITVTSAGPLTSQIHHRVDVVVTSEPTTGAGGGRTYVAARAVELLALEPVAEGSSAPGDPLADEQSVATLALTHSQALRLIHAQSFAREVRLIGS
jgi:Flp pilus assembly protein CpaB